ncbi:MAG: cell envelope integrity protein TolA, partial [Candidatus Omnitrophica bacterium]|nr:cell envelope integrity protein TolA [Candidatus Omnitrophota bacterium]
MPLLLRENTSTCRSEEDLAGIKEFYREFSLCRGGAVSFLTLMLTRAVKDISFAGIVVAIVGGVLPSCHAAVSRKEIMSYNLDYYTLKKDADAQKAAVEELEEKIKQGKKVKQEASAKANQEKLNKAKGLLQRIMKDFRSEVIIEEKYDDNIYLTHENRVSAFTTTIDTAFTYTPEIVWKQGHTSFSAKISGGPDENVTKRGTFTKARGEVRTSLRHTRGKYSFGANYNLKKDYSTSTELKTGAIEPESLVSFWERSYGATASMDWKYLPTDIEYYNKASLYRKDNRESNLIVQDVMLTNYFDIFPKTRFLYSYEYEVDRYPEREDTGSDSVTNTYWVGVKGRLSSKIDGVAKFGYQSKKMHVGGTISSDTEKIQLDYQMSQRLFHMIQAS